MIDLLGIAGVLVALVGSVLIFTAMTGMQKLVNSTRPVDQQYRGFALLPGVSAPVSKVMKAQYPGSSLMKRKNIGMGLIISGLFVMVIANYVNAHSS